MKLFAALPLLSLAWASPAPRQAAAEYDYIVVGSGPGGGPLASNLARANYSVLLLEAGDESVASGGDQYQSSITWDFFVKHYPDGDNRNNLYSHLTWRTPNGGYWVGQSGAPAGSKLLGVYYPRGATLGGSSMINAMATWLPSDSDWNHHVEVTGDQSWSASNMRSIFQKIEKNNYVPAGTPGHGFNGYFQTSMPKPPADNPEHPMMRAMAQSLKLTQSVQQLIQQDPNALDPNRDQTQSIYGLPRHQYADGRRYSSRYYVQETRDAGRWPLTVSLNSLATKVLFDTGTGNCGGTTQKPRAIGVEYIQGRSQYAGDARRGTGSPPAGSTKTAYARREVIISGGAFNSPQLLMLSGIGPAAHLRERSVTVLVDSPGVGNHLMDNQEMPIVGRTTGGGLGYGQTGFAMIETAHSSYGERDMFLMQGPYAFRGFWPMNQSNTALPIDPAGIYSVSLVKNHPVNTKGYVRLRSSDPRDMPDINFMLYQEGAEFDMGAMKDSVAWIRQLYRQVGVTPTEPPCTNINSDGTCANAKTDEDWIYKQTFGHHPTSTCRIGGDNDKNAVLDSKFRVRGVAGLRVVDASAFARIPGVFPAVATFMISQKASDDMIAELGRGEAIGTCPSRG